MESVHIFQSNKQEYIDISDTTIVRQGQGSIKYMTIHYDNNKDLNVSGLGHLNYH